MAIVIQKITLNSQSIAGPWAEKSLGSHQSAHVTGRPAACWACARPAGKASRTAASVVAATRGVIGRDPRRRREPSFTNCSPVGDQEGWMAVHHPPLE